MFLEGFIFRKSEILPQDKIKVLYNNAFFFDNGFFGVKFASLNNRLDYKAIVETENRNIEIVDDQIVDNFDIPVFFDSSYNLNRDIPGVLAYFSERNQELILARDLFGVTPFYYSIVPGKYLAFSTDLSSLVQQLGAKWKINRSRIAAYTDFLKEPGETYNSDTFYENVFTVPPGHILRLSLSGLHSAKPYVTFRPSKWSHLRTQEAFGEAFRGKFLAAVKRNISDSIKKPASHLSGGMDSSSVSAAIRLLRPDLPLSTLYDASDREVGESVYSRAVATKIGSAHHEIFQSEDDLALLTNLTSLAAQPIAAIMGPAANTSLTLFAKELGCDAIFNGRDGDSVVGSGFELINRVFAAGEYELVKDLLKKRVAHYSLSEHYPKWHRYSFEQKYDVVLQSFLFKRITAKMVEVPPAVFIEFFARINKHFKISYSELVRRGAISLFNKVKKGQIVPAASIAKEELLSLQQPDSSRFDVLKLVEADFSEGKRALTDVYNRHAILALEQNFMLGQFHGMPHKSPFYDQELFELCMAAPDILKYGDGIGRAHFREAMKGILPEEVRLRSSKTHVGMQGQDTIMRLYTQSSELLRDTKEVWELMDRDKFEHQVKVLQNAGLSHFHKVNTWFHISRTVSLATWLEWLNSTRQQENQVIKSLIS